jgi:hypothetical protein
MSGVSKWAPQTWVFLHTFAAKINKNFFEANREQCLSIITMICRCLPCPECTRHAAHYLSRVNGNTVKTKEEFILMLSNFHNSVNARTGKQQFPKESVIRYNSFRFDIALVNFIAGYSAKYGSIMSGRISTLGKRKSIAKSVNAWLKAHWRHFQN